MNEAQANRDTLAWHKAQVRTAVNEASRAKEQEIAQLKDTLIRAQREHNETRKRLKAAESLIEDFSKQVKQLRESAPSDKRLARRYEAAVELLDEALKRLPEIGSLGRRARTLEGLVQAGFDHILEDRKSRCVKEHLARIAPKYHSTVKPVLEACRTPAQIAHTFRALAVVSGVREAAPEHRRDPLPEGNRPSKPSARRQVNESQDKSATIVNMMAARLAKAVG
jgi:DNA repair ATPase RecN